MNLFDFSLNIIGNIKVMYKHEEEEKEVVIDQQEGTLNPTLRISKDIIQSEEGNNSTEIQEQATN